VDTDGSNFEVGGVSQVEDGQECVTAYYSKTLNKAERKYCVTRRDLLALLRTLEHLHKYFLSTDQYSKLLTGESFLIFNKDIIA
jgi:hypothetical protein